MAISDNIVALWKLDEASGNALDAVGSYGMTATGTPGALTGIVSGGRNLVRASVQYFGVASAAVTALPLTVACWFRCTSVSINQNIFCQAPASNNFAWGLAVNGSNKLQFYASNGSGSFDLLNGTTTISSGTWYFGAIVWRTATDREIYINAASEGTSSVSRTPDATNNKMRIGIYSGSSDADSFNGDVDEVAYWSRALSGSELTSLYNGGAGLAYPWSGGGGGGSNVSPLFNGLRLVNGVLVNGGLAL